LLAACHDNALRIAAELGARTVAFPAISTGVYRFPADLAARIAVGTVVSEISAAARGIDRVVFCCFSQESADHHVNAFTELGLA
jgi:O-acetyl-ADP-ribose deacetylase (regulator of RNase III)